MLAAPPSRPTAPIIGRRHLGNPLVRAARWVVAAVLVATLITGGTASRANGIIGCRASQLWSLSAAEDPYIADQLSDDQLVPLDVDGLPIFEVNGARYFHPIATAQWALYDLSRGRIAEASALADYLVSNSTVSRGARWFPYQFGWESMTGRLPVPWFSGMAQGQALSVFVRLYERSGNPRYLGLAREIAASFNLADDGSGSPWVVRHDGASDLWIEEYAGAPAPDPILNGMIFAIYGLYDYSRLTGDGLAPLCESIETIRRHIDAFRRPGELSWYDLQHHRVADGLYHRIHAFQLRTLARITHDPGLAEAADAFAADGRSDLAP